MLTEATGTNLSHEEKQKQHENFYFPFNLFGESVKGGECFFSNRTYVALNPNLATTFSIGAVNK